MAADGPGDDSFDRVSSAAASSGGASSDADADEPDTERSAEDILSALDRNYRDEQCLLLAQCIRDARTRDLPRLEHLIHRVAGAARSAAVSKDAWRRATALFDLEVLKSLHGVVSDALLVYLASLEEHVTYWKAQHARPLVRYLEQGPVHWYRLRPRDLLSTGVKPWLGFVAYMQRSDVDDVLRRLDEFQRGFTAQVGAFCRALRHLQDTNDFRRDVEPFAAVALELHAFLTQKAQRRSVSPFKCLRLLAEIVVAIPEFQEQVEGALALMRKPSAVQRYWLPVTATAAAAAVPVHALYQQRYQMRDRMVDAFASLRLFLRENVVAPMGSVLGYVFKPAAEARGSVTDIRESQEALATMLRDFGTAHRAGIAAAEAKSVEQFMAELPGRAARGDMTLVMTKYSDEIQSPVKNAVFGELVQGMLIQVQKVKVDTERTLVQLDEVMHSNEMNFRLAATVPAFLIVATSWWAVSWFWYRRREKQSHVRLRFLVHDLEDMLIRAAAPAVASSRGSGGGGGAARRAAGLDDDLAVGALLLQVHKIRALLPSLSRREAALLTRDLDLLVALDLDAHQKLLVLQRMYRVFSFLRPLSDEE